MEIPLCKLQICINVRKNRKGENRNAEPSATPDPRRFGGDRRHIAAQDRAGLTAWGTRREKITNDKLNLDSNDLIGILLAAAAALLCVTIDYFTKETDNDD